MTETKDSVVDDVLNGKTAMVGLRAIFQAVEDGAVLNIQGREYWPVETLTELHDQNRRLRYQLKQANRNVGKQGATIHQLRADIAEVRQLNSRAERGEIRALDRQVSSLKVLLDSAREEISMLNEKLREQDSDKAVDLDEQVGELVNDAE